MIDALSILDVFEFRCHRCGGKDPDTFEDLAAVELALTVRPPLTAEVQIQPPAGVGTFHAGDLAAGKPVHRRCQPGGEIFKTIAF